jgi:hypothetical protein
MTTGDPAKAPAQRIGYKERDAAVERLRTAAGDGQITLDELETRVEAALEARTGDDLAVLLADLPAPTGPALLAAAPPTARLTASHGRVDRLGSWRVPQEVVMDLRHSTGTLDLRSPVLPADGVRIAVQARHSSIKILVAPGTPVELDEVGRHHSVAKDPRGRFVTAWSGPPIVITGDLHHSSIKVLRPHDSWLRSLFQRRQRRALPPR